MVTLWDMDWSKWQLFNALKMDWITISTARFPFIQNIIKMMFKLGMYPSKKIYLYLVLLYLKRFFFCNFFELFHEAVN